MNHTAGRKQQRWAQGLPGAATLHGREGRTATAPAWAPAAAGCAPHSWPPEGRTAGRAVLGMRVSLRAWAAIDQASKSGGAPAALLWMGSRSKAMGVHSGVPGHRPPRVLLPGGVRSTAAAGWYGLLWVSEPCQHACQLPQPACSAARPAAAPAMGAASAQPHLRVPQRRHLLLCGVHLQGNQCMAALPALAGAGGHTPWQRSPRWQAQGGTRTAALPRWQSQGSNHTAALPALAGAGQQPHGSAARFRRCRTASARHRSTH